MSFHFNPFSVSLLMSGVVALLIAFLIWQGSTSVVKWFAILMFCIVTWAIAYSFELSSHSLEQMLFWIRIEYIGISFLPAMWIVFVVKFIGKNEWLDPKNIIAIMIFPLVTVLLVWTNQWHHLHYKDAAADVTGPFPLLAITPGPWYFIFTIYFYFLLALGIILLSWKFNKADVAFRRQIRAILLGASLPWMVNFIYLLGIRPYGHIDLTPYAFIATSLCIAYGLFRFRLFNMLPLAREKVIEEMQEGILVIDEQGRVIDMNPAMKTFLPRYVTEVIGEPFTDVFPERHRLHQLVNQEKDIRAEMEMHDDSGSRFYEVAVNNLWSANKTKNGVTLIFWDITDRKNKEQKIQELATQLGELNQLKDRLFSIVAHDLRGPFTDLSNLLNLLENRYISQQELEMMLPSLSQNVRYTVSMIENLLAWSASQMEGQSLNPDRFELKPVVLEKINFLRGRASEKGIILKENVPDGIMAFADLEMISLVLRNLISNAVKFCRRGDSIFICAEEHESHVTIRVNDTGPGMDAETVGKLFSMERISTRGTANEKGTGLGLKLCKEFVERNNGTFWVASTPGQGSVFSFTLSSAN